MLRRPGHRPAASNGSWPSSLEEFRRVLRVGGRIRVASYDLQAGLDAYARKDADFFWDHSSTHLSGALASWLLEAGAARSLLDADLVVELLEQAGFADAERRRFRDSGIDPALAALDELGDHCSYVEAWNPSSWPVVEPAAEPSAVHLALGDSSGRSMEVIWCGAGRKRGVRLLLAGRSVDLGREEGNLSAHCRRCERAAGVPGAV